MRILLSANEYMSERTLDSYLKKFSIEANLISAADPEIIMEIISLCKIDVLAYYADTMEEEELINFISRIYKLKRDILFVLIAQSEDSERYAEALEIYADEFILLPVDLKEFHIKFRRLCKKFELKQRELTVSAKADHFDFQLGNEDITAKPEAPKEQYIPPQNYAQDTSAPVNISAQRKAEFYSYNLENKIPGQNSEAGLPDIGWSVPALQQQPEENHVNERKKHKNKKSKSPLRSLNKTELLEIIYEQEKRLQNPNENAMQPIKD